MSVTSPAVTTPEGTTESPRRRKRRLQMGSGLVGMGVLHAVMPKPFEAIVPQQLGAPRFWNLAAGLAEGAAGALLLSSDPRRQRIGGALATATIVGVYPANIDMAIKAGKPTTVAEAVPWLRLPLQFPMVRTTWSLARPET